MTRILCEYILKREGNCNKGTRRKFVFDFRKLAEMKRRFMTGENTGGDSV